MYENQYFQLETITNVDGYPTFLLVEGNEGTESIKFPPYVKILGDVTGDAAYKTKNLS